MIQCPFCSGINEATVRNDEMRPGLSQAIGPVWHCSLCEQDWTDWEAEALVEAETQAVLADLPRAPAPVFQECCNALAFAYAAWIGGTVHDQLAFYNALIALIPRQIPPGACPSCYGYADCDGGHD